MFSSLRMLVSTTALLVFSALAPGVASAGVVQDVARDFKPLSGYVVMPVGGEFLVDLDAAAGLRAGDLLAVVKPGERVVHPVTQEVLGTLDEVKGRLKVTRVKSGYSYAQPLGDAGAIGRGDQIRRYQNLTAVFWDYTGQGEGIYSELKAALPALDWQGFSSAEGELPSKPVPQPHGGADLLFILTSDGLKVRDAAFQVLRSYPLSAAVKKPLAPSVAASPLVALPVAVPTSAETGTAILKSVQPAASAIVREEKTAPEGIWYSPDMEGTAVGVEIADFDGDGRLEIATAFPHRVEIGRNLEGAYTRLATVDLGVKVLALDGADLDRDGKSELYVTAASDGSLSSLVVAHSGTSFLKERGGLSWYFRSLDLPGEGRVLLAQKMGTGESDFAGPIFRVSTKGGELAEGEPVAAPARISLFGFLPFSSAAGDNAFLHLTSLDRLHVLSGEGVTLWESEERFGGSEAYIERLDPALLSDTGMNTRNAFLQARIEAGAGDEILVPSNEGSRFFRQTKKFNKSSLKSMIWDGHVLREAWHTQPQSGYMADFRLADFDNDGKKEILMGMVFTREGFKSKGRSALVGYELE